jgi:hypothetical protein
MAARTGAREVTAAMARHLDQEIAALAEALVYRLRNRGDGPGQYATDDELFAREYAAVITGRGWRPTEARRAGWQDTPTGNGKPPEDVRRELEALRARLAGTEE